MQIRWSFSTGLLTFRFISRAPKAVAGTAFVFPADQARADIFNANVHLRTNFDNFCRFSFDKTA